MKKLFPRDDMPIDHSQNLPEEYWSIAPEALLSYLNASEDGLDMEEASKRLRQDGLNALEIKQGSTILTLLFNQIKSPLVLILIFAAIVSAVVREWADAGIVLVVVLGSTILGFIQEYNASTAVDKLRSRVTLRANVLRNRSTVQIPVEQIVAGDVVLLSAGSLIPADGVVLEAKDFFVNQVILTGESFPVEKKANPVPANASLVERANCVYMGTNVGGGTARVLIIKTGKGTLYGQIAKHLSLGAPETDFERGIQRFGNMLTQIMMVLVVAVMAINVVLEKPAIDSLLFALALAVGMAPELLPAIISITLAQGAQKMAKRGVIVRRLNAIENFGSMDILCTDKTGTLTQGVASLDSALDIHGNPSDVVLRYAYLNAYFQTGLNNPLDEAIIKYGEECAVRVENEKKLSEIPYDFIRKRLSVITSGLEGGQTMITKGALEQVLEISTSVLIEGNIQALDSTRLDEIEQLYDGWSEQGFRVLGIAFKLEDGRPSFSRSDEKEMIFAGFLLFFDPPKAGVEEIIADLKKRCVQIKIITGDNHKVARHIAAAVNLPSSKVLTGKELDELHNEALWHAAERTTIFAEVDPTQKEQIIRALQKSGHVVGYMGDGINDAPALHVADVGISVDTAVDVAKESADFVLLRQDLGILREGIDEGRATFANTLKYILTTISANFGNMFSMAGASVLLKFLPLLAPQILLNNFLSDIPGTTIASDNVDSEWIAEPRRWDTIFIRNYMIVFGLVSSLFDFATFGILLFIFHSSPEEFRTGWFIESLLTELVIALIVRTRHPFFRSKPSKLLLFSTLAVIGITIILPYLPVNKLFGFIPLPLPLLGAVLGLILFYVLATELVKKVFYSKYLFGIRRDVDIEKK